MLGNLHLRHVRLELSRGAYIRIDSDGKNTEIGLYKIFYSPFVRGFCLGYLNSRQFKTLLSSGFIIFCHERDAGDGYTHSYYVAGGMFE